MLIKRKIATTVVFINMPNFAPFSDSPSDASEENLGIGYIASFLKYSGVRDVHLIDAASRKLHIDEIFNEICMHCPDFVGMSPTYITLDSSIEIAHKLKLLNKNIKIILGGPHVSFEPILSRLLWSYDDIDFIVSGEGEIPMLEIILNCFYGRAQNIQGVSFRMNGNAVISKEYSKIVQDLDSVPFPMRDLNALKGKALRITTSRGCYRQNRGCNFCSTPSLYPEGWRARSAQNVVTEMQELSKLGFDTFICAESDFIGFSDSSLKRAHEIADEILSRNLNIKLRVFAGVRQILRSEASALWGKLQRCGLERVYPGIESGDDFALNIFNKHQTLPQIHSALNILHKHKIAIQIGFIMFHPWSSVDSLLKNCIFLEEIGQAHLWHNFSTALLLLPGSVLLNKVKHQNLLKYNLNSVDLGEKFVYNYKYINKEISKISEGCMTLLRNSIIAKLDRMLITANIFFEKISLVRVKTQTQNDFLYRYDIFVKELSKKNICLFKLIINLIHSGCSQYKIDELILKHVRSVELLYVDLKDLLFHVR